jgi:hypothetical protein
MVSKLYVQISWDYPFKLVYCTITLTGLVQPLYSYKMTYRNFEPKY